MSSMEYVTSVINNATEKWSNCSRSKIFGKTYTV